MRTLFILALAAFSACGPTSKPVAVTPVPPKSVPLADTGLNGSWLDKKADACQDFYQVACGGLLDHVEIPADKAAWGPTQALQEQTEAWLRATLEKAAKDPVDDPIQKKLGIWFGACMDEGSIEKAQIKALEPLLDAVAKVKDTVTLYAAIARLHQHTIFPFFGIASQQDYKDATLVIAGLDQDGLGLPDRDYYIEQDPKTIEVRDFYRGHVARMFGLAGDPATVAASATDDVMRIETALAKLAQDKVARRNPYNVYNRIDRKGLATAAKTFPWDTYFKSLGFADIATVSVNSVSYFSGIDALMTTEKPAAFKSYLRWKVLASQGSRLGKAFVDERFALRKRLTGQKELEPRWRRCVQSTDGALGELLAQAFVKAKFDEASKQSAESLLDSIRAAMKTELAGLPWMDAATRAAANDKLVKMNGKIGHPIKWKSYDFEVRPSAHAENALASDAFELVRSLRKVGKPLDRTEWQMTPPTVNAYYDPSMNEMVFPAGILQPPFFSKTFSAAVNFGATGATMGHELTHGFDDEGSQFDGSGNLRNWWSESTGTKFKDQTKCVVAQYGKYEAVPGVKLNGELTAGENIADIGGLKLALNAFRASRANATDRFVSDGYTEDQIFFLAYAQSWCEKDRPEYLELIAKTNPHSPPRFRVNGVVADIPAFAEAFSCPSATPMHPTNVCAVW